MKNKKDIIILSFILVLLLTAFFMGEAMGVGESNIEKDARKNQKIDDTWLCTKDTTDELGVVLFYDSALDNHIFSIYINAVGFSYGYFFREGGSLGSVDSGIQGFSYQNKGMALLSMNKKRISKIEMNNGEKTETVTLDPLQPFAIVVPSNIGTVTLYNSYDEEVPIDNISVS